MNLPAGFEVVGQSNQNTGLPDGFEVVQQSQPVKQKMSKWDSIKNGYNILKGGAESIDNAIQGNAEFEDARSWEQYSDSLPWAGGMGGLKVAAAGMFGNDEDKLNSIKHNFPELQIQQDRNGNPYFMDKENKPVYIDDPRLDLGDIADAVGEAGSYMVGGGLTAPIKNSLTRGVATGGAMATVNAGNQALAGREKIDTSEVATAGLLGGVVESASPYVGKVFTWAKNRLTGSEQIIKDGQKLANSKNLKMNDTDLETLGRIRNTLDDSVSDDAIIAELNHGLKLTKGQATGNLRQLSKEQQLKEQPALMNRFRQIDDFNQEKVEQNLRQIRANMSGQVDDVLEPAVTAETAQSGLKNAERNAKKQYQEAYNDVGNLFVKNEAVNGLEQRLVRAIPKSGVRFSEKGTPKASEAIQIIKEAQKELADNATNINAKGFSLKEFDHKRKLINSLYSNGMDQTDKKALTIVKNKLDDWFYTSIDDSLLKGDPKALEQLTKARGLMAEYSSRFNSKDNVNKVISKIVKEEKTPEEFSQMLVGVNGTSKPGAGNLVKAYKTAVGEDSDGFKALKAHVFEKIILSNATKSDGSTALKGYQGMMSAFNQAFSTKGKTMMKEIFTQDEAVQIKSLMRSVGRLVVDKDLINASGSGRFGARLLAEYGSKIPLLGKLFDASKNISGFVNSQKLPVKQLDMRVPEVLGVTQTAN